MFFEFKMHNAKLCKKIDDAGSFSTFSGQCILYTNPSRSNPGRREKIRLSFYFHTSLWPLKRFYEDLKGLHKTYCEALQRSVKIKI